MDFYGTAATIVNIISAVHGVRAQRPNVNMVPWPLDPSWGATLNQALLVFMAGQSKKHGLTLAMLEDVLEQLLERELGMVGGAVAVQPRSQASNALVWHSRCSFKRQAQLPRSLSVHATPSPAEPPPACCLQRCWTCRRRLWPAQRRWKPCMRLLMQSACTALRISWCGSGSSAARKCHAS